MIVEQIYAFNSLRNFNYIIACENTKEAVVIDPLRVDKILELAREKNYKIKAIINTHEHRDHTDGNQELVAKTQAQVYCHHKAIDRVPLANNNSALKAGDILTIGEQVKLEVLDTPGHTMAHVCIIAQDNQLALFSGDTLFNAGTGHCFHGNIDDLYNTFDSIFEKLPNETLIYPGHDYLKENIRFTLSREPDNIFAKNLLAKAEKLPEDKFIIATLEIERKINTFFRLNSQTVINNLESVKNKINPSRKEIFVALRAMRDEW